MRPSARRLFMILACAVALAPAGARSQPTAGEHPRTVFVGVADGRGAPVLDLAAADFEITERGIKRPVVKAELARSPMRIALFVDTGEGANQALNHLRGGLPELIDAVPPPHELLIVSTGRQARVRVPPTTDRKKLKDTAASLFGDGGGTPLRDALLEMDERFMRKAEDRWPVFVIVTSDGSESSGGASEKRFNDWLRTLPQRGIAVHAIVMKFRGGSATEVVANGAVEAAGGIYEVINTSNSLAAKLKGIADRLNRDYQRVSTKYAVTFTTPSTEGPVTIGIARDGVKIESTQGRLR